MFCRKCGKEIEGAAKFCPYCGSPVQASEPPGYSGNPRGNDNDNRTAKRMQKPGKKKKGGIIILVVIIIAVIAAGGFFLVPQLFKDRSENISSPNESSSFLFADCNGDIVSLPFGESTDNIYWTVDLPSDAEVYDAYYLLSGETETLDATDDPVPVSELMEDISGGVFGRLGVKAGDGETDSGFDGFSILYNVMPDYDPEGLCDTFYGNCTDYTIVEDKAIVFEQHDEAGHSTTIRMYIPAMMLDGNYILQYTTLIFYSDSTTYDEAIDLEECARDLYETVSLKTEGIDGFIDAFNEVIEDEYGGKEEYLLGNEETAAAAADTKEGAEETAEDAAASGAEEEPYERYQIAQNYGLYSGFSEGLAWVSVETAEQTYELALISDDGKIITDFSGDEIKGIFGGDVDDIKDLAASSFQSGYSCVYENAYLENRPYFFIVNSAGEITYQTKTNDETSTMYCLGQYNDTFLVFEKQTGFSSVDYYIYMIDAYGNELSEKAEYDTDEMNYHYEIRPRFTYMGEGIFMNSYSVYNAQSQQFMTFPYEQFKMLTVYGGKSVGCYGSGIWRPFKVSEILANQTTLDAFKISIGSRDGDREAYTAEHPECIYDITPACVNDGIYYTYGDQSHSAGYYRYDGTFITALPSFSTDVEILDYSAFSGGYALLEMEGADGNNYVTAFDEAGTLMYEPIQVYDFAAAGSVQYHTYTIMDDAVACQNGYILVYMTNDDFMNANFSVITPTGEVLKPGEGDLSGIGEDTIIGDIDIPGNLRRTNNYSSAGKMYTYVSGGYFIYTYLGNSAYRSDFNEYFNRYISLDGTKIIETADQFR